MASEIPVWLGGSAEAVSAISSVAALAIGIRNARLQGARTWPALVEEISELSADELRAAVESHPWVAQVVGLAWEEAARTSSEQKRRLLARVAVAALQYGPLADKVQSLPFLVRTVANLEPPHIHVMIAIAIAISPDRDWDPASKSEYRPLENEALGPLALPIYGQLQREGLIEKNGGMWRITEYGWEFLTYLAKDDPTALAAYVDFYSLSRDGKTGTLVLKNYGTASAILTAVQAEFVRSNREWDYVKLSVENFSAQVLRPGEKCSFDFKLDKNPQVAIQKVLRVTLQWNLADGSHVKAERRSWLEGLSKKGSWLGRPPMDILFANAAL
jgi:hypothetical protein